MERKGENRKKTNGTRSPIEDTVKNEAINLYPDGETDEGIRPRCNPESLAGGEFSTYPAENKSFNNPSRRDRKN